MLTPVLYFLIDKQADESTFLIVNQADRNDAYVFRDAFLLTVCIFVLPACMIGLQVFMVTAKFFLAN